MYVGKLSSSDSDVIIRTRKSFIPTRTRQDNQYHQLTWSMFVHANCIIVVSASRHRYSAKSGVD
jgi:hypothetical protein